MITDILTYRGGECDVIIRPLQSDSVIFYHQGVRNIYSHVGVVGEVWHLSSISGVRYGEHGGQSDERDLWHTSSRGGVRYGEHGGQSDERDLWHTSSVGGVRYGEQGGQNEKREIWHTSEQRSEVWHDGASLGEQPGQSNGR